MFKITGHNCWTSVSPMPFTAEANDGAVAPMNDVDQFRRYRVGMISHLRLGFVLACPPWMLARCR